MICDAIQTVVRLVETQTPLYQLVDGVLSFLQHSNEFLQLQLIEKSVYGF